MNLADVMDEIAARLDTITGLRVFAYPPDNISPHAAIVNLPESIGFDLTMGRGSDRITLPVDVIVGRVSDRASRDAIAPYFDGSGTKSIKQVIESGSYTAFDTVRVTAADDPFAVWVFASVAYLAGVFSLDIAGEGA